MPGIRRVVQLNNMFLLIETEHGIRLVDQHALHEKALFLCLDPTDVAAGGVQVRSCLRRCASYMAPAGAEDAGDAVEDTGASDSSPADGQTASAWTLLIAALFLAGL